MFWLARIRLLRLPSCSLINFVLLSVLASLVILLERIPYTFLRSDEVVLEFSIASFCFLLIRDFL